MVSNIPAGDGKTVNLSLQCTYYKGTILRGEGGHCGSVSWHGGGVEPIPREHKYISVIFLKVFFIPLLQFSSSPLYTVYIPTDQLSSYKIDASTLTKAFSTRPGISKHSMDGNRYYWRRSLKH